MEEAAVDNYLLHVAKKYCGPSQRRRNTPCNIIAALFPFSFIYLHSMYCILLELCKL